MIVVSTPKLITLCLLLSSLIASALGNALQPLAVLAFLQPLLSLISYDRLINLADSRSAWSSRALSHCIALLSVTMANAIGGTIAFSGVLSFPTTTILSVSAAFGFALATSLTISVFAILGNYMALAHWGRGSAISVITFPCLYTASYSFMAIFISSFISPGNALMDYEPLRQMCSVWGLSGTIFLMASTVGLAFLHLAAAVPSFLGREESEASLFSTESNLPSSSAALPRDTYTSVPHKSDEDHHVLESDDYSTFVAGPPGAVQRGGERDADFDVNASSSSTRPVMSSSPQVPPSLYRASVLLLATWATVSLVGGLLSQATLFYQRDVTTVVPKSIKVSCLIESSASEGSPEWERIWNRTSVRINHHRDDLILWAEESVNISAGEGEERMFARIRSLLANSSSSSSSSADKGSYLGVAYQAWHQDQLMFTNHFVLFQPNGEIAWNYLKAYPVPIVEDDVKPGPAQLPFHDSPFGRLSGAICFDLDHAHFALQAAKNKADIFLQPSWTWGSVGPRHWTGNQLRAIEGGYSIIRCSSSGVSGSVSPGGLVTSQFYTGEEQEEGFMVPLLPRRWTPYVGLGFHYVEWANLAIAGALWVVLIAYQPVLDLWGRYEAFLETGTSGGRRRSSPQVSRRLLLGKRAEVLKLKSPGVTPSKEIGLQSI